MKRLGTLVLLTLLLFGFVEHSLAAEKSWLPENRQVRVGLSAGQFLSDDLGVRTQLFGPMLRYEFVINPRFHLGLQTSYRYGNLETEDGKASKHLYQLAYGTVFQHRLGMAEALSPFYVSYGLLMQVIKEEGVVGRGTAHNTRMALGAELSFAQNTAVNFVELAYNYSRLHYFGTDEKSLDYLELNLGVRI